MTRPGISFETKEVVDLYLYRPPYPDALFQHLVECAPQTQHLLDLGCGHGKVSRRLAGSFANVTAIDPSDRMIALGKSLPNGDAPNISWTTGLAEQAVLPRDTFDMAVAALSLHWMDQDRLFPVLSGCLRKDHVFAVIAGDDASDPAWGPDWHAFLQSWVPTLTGRPFRYRSRSAFWQGNARYAEVFERRSFHSAPIRQSVDDFILCQHSRDTFAISKLGDQLARFDGELRDILTPHADDHGNLEFRVKTNLTLAHVLGA